MIPKSMGPKQLFRFIIILLRIVTTIVCHADLHAMMVSSLYTSVTFTSPFISSWNSVTIDLTKMLSCSKTRHVDKNGHSLLNYANPASTHMNIIMR